MGEDGIPLSDWERVVTELRTFADGAPVEETDDRVRVEFRNASVEVRRDGTVVAGMPLHELSAEGATRLAFDHGAGELRVTGGGVDYTFRRP